MGYKIEANPEKLEAFANNIVNELAFLESQADTLDSELDDIIRFCSPEYVMCFNGVGNTAITSDQVIERLDKHERDIRNASNKLQEQDDILGQMYNLYDSYGSMVAIGAAAVTPGKYLAIGLTGYFRGENGKWFYKSPEFLDDLAKIIDESKYKNIFRTFLYPNVFSSNHGSKSLADLLHRKFTKFFPEDAVDFTNAMNTARRNRLDEFGKKTPWKNWKNVWTTGEKFAKSNVLLTAVITSGVEGVGAGIAIADNYNKYGENIEVLKRENAKAVAKSLNNTVWTTGGAVVGTFIGGALGTLASPAGTVIGGAAGGAAGAWVGEKMAGVSAGFVESVALHLDDPIHKGIEGIRKINGDVTRTVEKAREVYNDVKDEANKHVKKTIKVIGDAAEDTANNMINSAKKFLSNPFSFG